MPLGMGPLSYSLTVTPEKEAGRLRNVTDFKIDIRDVNINDSELPVFDLRLMPACTRLRMSGCRASQRISYLARIWRSCPASVPTAA